MISCDVFLQLKGIPHSEIGKKVQEMVDMLDLKWKLKVEARKLSGGLKRKLCIGNALIGDPKVGSLG